MWAVKYRDAVLRPEMKPLVVDTIHRVLADRGHTPFATNFEPDHLHTLFKFTAREDIGKTLQAIKGTSSHNLNAAFFAKADRFRWQSGYAAFSVCPTHVRSKKQYIDDQQEIHARRRFELEYRDMLDEAPLLDLGEDDEPYWDWVPLEER